MASLGGKDLELTGRELDLLAYLPPARGQGSHPPDGPSRRLGLSVGGAHYLRVCAHRLGATRVRRTLCALRHLCSALGSPFPRLVPMPEERRLLPDPASRRPASRRPASRGPVPRPPVPRRWVWPLPRLVADLAAAGFVAWEGLQGRYSTASHVSILAVIAAVLVLATIAGRGRQRRRSRTWLRVAWSAVREQLVRRRARSAVAAGVLGWVLVISATVGWDGFSFAMQRHSLPTLSRLIGAVTDHEWGRALLFAAWLAFGLYLAVGWRLGLQEPRAKSRGLGDPGSTPPRSLRSSSRLHEEDIR